MTSLEQGFLLLTSSLGDPGRCPLTVAQFRNLANRAKLLDPVDKDREMTSADLVSIGFDSSFANRVITLLSQKEQLQWYLTKGEQCGCQPLSRISKQYPGILRAKLGLDGPGCLWGKGDFSLLNTPMISLVGSRDLQSPNREFAKEAGKQAALQGFTLVTGNARGADRVALEACLSWGGNVIGVVADELAKHCLSENVLLLSEEGFDSAFSSARALSRNRIIHCLGMCTLVAQCNLGKGGTWDGTTKNLRHAWSDVFVFDDNSEAASELLYMGAHGISASQLDNLRALSEGFIKPFA